MNQSNSWDQTDLSCCSLHINLTKYLNSLNLFWSKISSLNTQRITCLMFTESVDYLVNFFLNNLIPLSVSLDQQFPPLISTKFIEWLDHKCLPIYNCFLFLRIMFLDKFSVILKKLPLLYSISYPAIQYKCHFNFVKKLYHKNRVLV